MMRPILFAAMSIATIANANVQPSAPAQKKTVPATNVSAKTLKPFTGKVSANKVRIRAKPDLESHIIRQVSKNELLLVVGEDGDFYCIEPPAGTKAYIFRSYALDDVIEANRVNVRLEPHADAPIIGQLEAGAKIASQVCPLNHKWLEIPVPSGVHFYISKEFITHAGGPEYLTAMENKKRQVNEMLVLAYATAEIECKKHYEAMAVTPATELFQNIVRNFPDFPDAVQQAKEGLAHLKETYLNKKIAFLEAKAELSPSTKQELLTQHKEETQELLVEPISSTEDFWKKRIQSTGEQGSAFWEALEESLYLSWNSFHAGKKVDDFYEEQKANAVLLTGKIEPYTQQIKEKPGNYILKGVDTPLAYLYSTHINLENYTGKTVQVLVSPRPNNHFAFPAYFVLAIE